MALYSSDIARERAVAYMRENTATTEANIRNEIDRYIAWPGQATAYLIGRQEILRQLERARAELRDRFDISDFHHEITGHGSLPLDVLGELISVRAAHRHTGTATHLFTGL
ncbi:DUF885 family protein [Streptomyces sp. NPDC014735]|uniref:DUF885 family protein n=1 Tax=unclassified Streptomyces TaxID=2593676 RepID=UPI0036F6E856